MSARVIYLIESGEYSSYGVHMAFTARELAEAFCERENALDRGYHDNYSVMEMAILDELPVSYISHSASALLKPDGTIANLTFGQPTRELGGIEDAWNGDKATTHLAGDTWLRVNYHRSEDEARKALYDLAARVKAEREGVA